MNMFVLDDIATCYLVIEQSCNSINGRHFEVAKIKLFSLTQSCDPSNNYTLTFQTCFSLYIYTKDLINYQL